MPRKQPTPEPEASGAGVSRRGSKEAISKKKKSAAAKKQGKVKSTQEPQASKDAAAKEAAAKATAMDKGTPAKKTLGLKNPGPPRLVLPKLGHSNHHGASMTGS